MENIYRCSICGKEYTGFSAEKDCLNDEINCLNLKEKFNVLIKETMQLLTDKQEIKFIEVKYNVTADSDNHGMDYEIYKYFNGKAEYKGETFDFYISNGNCEDGEWSFNSANSLVNTFAYKYIREQEIHSKEVVGIVEFHENNSIDEESGYHYHQHYYSVGNQNIDKLLYDLKGKKIRIEIL